VISPGQFTAFQRADHPTTVHPRCNWQRLAAPVIGIPRCSILLTAIVAFLVAMWLALATSQHAYAAVDGVVVEIFPPTVETSREGAATARVVVRNTTTATLENMAVSWFSNMGVTLTVAPPTSTALLPDSSLAWTLTVTREPDDTANGNVYIQIDFVMSTVDGARSQVIVAPLPLQNRSAEPTEAVVDLQLRMPTQSLTEFTPADLYLIVTNRFTTPITITAIKPRGPLFVELTPVDTEVPYLLAPGATHVFTIDANATTRVQPGDYTIVVETDLEWQQYGRKWANSQVVSENLTVGVYGLSDILTLLAVPSFVLLPGLLLLVFYRFAWRVVERQDPFELDLKSVEFWAWSITLSGLVAFVYPLVMGIFTNNTQSYFYGYGLNDVMQVWLACFVGGVLVSLSLWAIRNRWRQFWQWYAQRQAARLTPTALDEPLPLLRKLHLQKLPLRGEGRDLNMNGKVERVYLAQIPSPGLEQVWVTPGLVVNRDQAPAELQSAIEMALANDQFSALIEALARGLEDKTVTIRWRDNQPGPRQVQINSLTDVARANPLVEVE
jgi:hypothetical protein